MESWSIYCVYSAEKGIFGVKYHHAFLMLVDDATGEGLRELHFASLSAKGNKVVRSLLRPMNLMGIAADRFRLLSAFNRAVDKTRAGKHLIRIKGVQTGGRRKLQDVAKSRRAFTGSPAQVMDLWNTACREALALSETDTPFVARGLAKPGINCQAGTAMSLESMGLPSGPLTPRHIKTGFGRKLRSEIKGLDKIHHTPTTKTLAEVLQENAALGRALYAARPQARFRTKKVATPASM